MVKTVIGEEHRLNSVEDRLSHSGLNCQVGLVIGKISTNLDKGFVFDLIPTPVNDAGDDATWIVESKDESKKRGGGGGKKVEPVSVLAVDKEWVAEHARQVSRMLVGGMKVVGIYIWVNENLFKNSTLVLCQTVKGVADAAPLRESSWDERLLIHISLSPRRFPIFRENISTSGNFAGILRNVISSHAEELKEVKALIDGNLVNVDEPCAFDGLHEVEFLTPFMQHTSFQAYNKDEVVGILVFSGSICSFAYSNSKEPISQALADIKGDIISSLHSRLDIICDEADGQLESIADDGESVDENSTQTPTPQLQLQSLRKWCSLSFPRRVFVPWLGDTYICDYIQPSETLEVLNEHCVELMSMEAPTDASTILEPEAESTSSLTLSPNSFWEKAMPFSTESGPSSLNNSSVDKSSAAGKQVQKSGNISIMLALLVLILSVLVGVFLFASRT
ncbi:protein ODR-4 [Tanacetum coccineum]